MVAEWNGKRILPIKNARDWTRSPGCALMQQPNYGAFTTDAGSGCGRKMRATCKLFVNRLTTAPQSDCFVGSGGGTRPPDTRIMIQIVSADIKRIFCKPSENLAS